MIDDISIERASVPDCLVDEGVRLVRKAQDLLCDVDEVARAWTQLEGAVELLKPPAGSLTVQQSGRITEEWHEEAGVGPLLDVLLQMASVIVDRTGCGAGGARPLRETNNAADAWREAHGDRS